MVPIEPQQSPSGLPAVASAGNRACSLRRDLEESFRTSLPAPERADAVHPAVEWARSGAMWLSGYSAAAPRLSRAPLATAVRGALHALSSIARPGAFVDLDACALLAERAALADQERNGRTSAGGSCRLVRAADGWLAVNLPRPDDLSLLPAWLERGVVGDPWEGVERAAASRPVDELVARGRLLGMAVASSGPFRPSGAKWMRVVTRGPGRRTGHGRKDPLVIDLSSLWAGPLCANLLQRAGARVVKVESVERPDGARLGAPDFFDRLHAGKRSVALSFRSPDGRKTLRRLLEAADIVVESSRPRALEQLGIDAAALVRSRPGLTWLSITGYGRLGQEGNWVAFGDDAAVAAGLSAVNDDPDDPVFYGDAIADPLTGIHAALAACASHHAGGGHLIDVSLRGVTESVIAVGDGIAGARIEHDQSGFAVVTDDGERTPVALPRARPSFGKASPLGADGASVFEEIDDAC